MKDIKLLAFDFDGTLFDSMKQISEENLAFLRYAKSRGVELVPATGRLYNNLPDSIKVLCRYFILSNGASVYDSAEDRYLYEAPMSLELALEIYRYGDTLPCIYDAYLDNWGWMTRSMYENMDEYFPDKNYIHTMLSKRTPVDDLKTFIREKGLPVQKIQFYFTDLDLRSEQITAVSQRFPGKLYVSTSLESNIEINSSDAVKGKALAALCAKLNISLEQVAAIGDGTNDLSMIEQAGTGICMCNGAEACKEAADLISEYDNNHSGFARVLADFI